MKVIGNISCLIGYVGQLGTSHVGHNCYSMTSCIDVKYDISQITNRINLAKYNYVGELTQHPKIRIINGVGHYSHVSEVYNRQPRRIAYTTLFEEWGILWRKLNFSTIDMVRVYTIYTI